MILAPLVAALAPVAQGLLELFGVAQELLVLFGVAQTSIFSLGRSDVLLFEDLEFGTLVSVPQSSITDWLLLEFATSQLDW